MQVPEEITDELFRSMEVYPEWPTDPLHALAILGEEFGELTKDVLQLSYEPHKTTIENVRKEAVQVAAMALRFYNSLGVYIYRYGDCHEQLLVIEDGLPEIPHRLEFAQEVGTPAKPADNPRRATSITYDSERDLLVALCEDGTAWRCRPGTMNPMAWEPLPTIPQGAL